MTGQTIWAAHTIRRLPVVSTIVVGGAATGVLLAAVGERIAPAAVILLPMALAVPFVVLRYPPAAAFAIAASWPLGVSGVGLGPVRLEPVQLIVMAVAPIVAVDRLLRGRGPIAWSPTLWWVVAWVVAGVVASGDALVVDVALREVLLLAGGLVTAVVVLSVCDSLSDVRSVLVAVAIAGVIVAVDALSSLSELRSAVGGLSVSGRAEGIFTSPNQLGAATLLVGLPSAGLAMSGRSRLQRVVGATGALASAAALVLSLSRGAWFGALVGVLVLVIGAHRARRTIVRLAPLIVLAGGAVLMTGAVGETELAVVRQRAETLALAVQGGDAYGERPAIWREALRQFIDEPLTGQGPANFVIASRRPSSEASTVGAVHAHNTVLDVAAEYGATGLVALLGFAVTLAVVARRALARSPTEEARALAAGLAAAVSALAAHSLVDHTLGNALISSMLWLVVGAMLALRHLPSGTASAA